MKQNRHFIIAVAAMLFGFALSAQAQQAKIGETSYETLSAAFGAVQNGETITLLDNFDIDTETYTIKDGVAVTLDMNGKTLMVTDNKTSGDYEMFYNYGELTVTGNGTINLTATTNREWNAMSAIFHNRGGKLTIENGTFRHNKGTNMAFVVNNSANSFGDAYTYINGGTLYSGYIAIRNRMEVANANGNPGNGTAYLYISGGIVEGVSRSVWGQQSSSSAVNPATGEIYVSGGELKGLLQTPAGTSECKTVISGGKVESVKCEAGELQITDKAAVTGEMTILSAAGEVVPSAVRGDGTVVEAKVKVGEAVYETINEAIAAAQPNDVVTLLADITSNDIVVINKALVLEGNGKKLVSTAGRAINVNGADGVTIQNLTIEASGERAINIIQNATNVTIRSVKATAANYAVNVASSAPNAVVSISDSELTGLNVVNIAATNVVATITNTILNCNDQSDKEAYAAVCICEAGGGTKVTVTGGKVIVSDNSSPVAIFAYDATVTFNGTEGVEDTDVKMVVAMIGDYGFFTLQSAFDYTFENPGKGDIVLRRDVEVGECLQVKGNVTLDMNDFAIKRAEGYEGDIFEVNGDLNLKGGTVADGIGFVINDSEYKTSGAEYSFVPKTVEKITYTRTFGHTNWQVLYVPFAIPYADFEGAFTAYEIAGVEDNYVQLTEITEGGEISANTPYLIKARQTGEVTITVEDAEVNVIADNSVSTNDGVYTFTGTYSAMNNTTLKGLYCYVLSGGTWKQLSEDNTKAMLGAFRVYLTINESAGSARALGMRIVGEQHGEGTTSIEQSSVAPQHEAVVYDLFGRRVATPTKGIVIINGKKVVIK